MTIEDTSAILVQQDMITVDTTVPNSARPLPGQSIKFPRGRKSGVARKHLQRPTPQKQMEGGNKSSTQFVAPAHCEISWDQGKVELWLEAWEKKGYLTLKPEKLKWTPFVLSRTKAGVEVLQAEAGLGSGIIAHTGTLQSPMEGGAPTPDDGDLVKSLGSRQSSSNEQNEQVAVVHDAAEVTAANLFDDLLPEKMNTPKKRLRNRPRDASPDSIAMSTRSASARAILDDDSGLNEESSDALPDVEQRIEDVTPTMPIKRRRGRPPRVRLPDKLSVVSQSFLTESGPTLSPKPPSPRKRRKLDSPSPEDPHTSIDLAYTEGRDGRDRQPAHRVPVVVNGDGHATNGVHRESVRHSPSTVLAVETKGGEKVPERKDDFTQQESSDVKSEDLGTPLTGLTSRHSVPSDDTVVVTEGVNDTVVRSKISGEGEGGPQSQGAGDVGATEDAVALRMVVEDSDLDAEGEPDDEIEI